MMTAKQKIEKRRHRRAVVRNYKIFTLIFIMSVIAGANLFCLEVTRLSIVLGIMGAIFAPLSLGAIIETYKSEKKI